MAKDQTQQIMQSILQFLDKNTKGYCTSDIAQHIGRNRITVGKYLDLLEMQSEVQIRRIGQAKVYVRAQHKPKVLIVDDEQHIVDLIALTLNNNTYTIFKAGDGLEALETVARENPDIIILDLMMPRMDGYEVCKRLKQSNITNNIPIIILSAKSQTDDKIKGLEFGADDYLTKPFDPLELEARVSAILRKKQQQSNHHPLTGLEIKDIKFNIACECKHMDEFVKVFGYQKAAKHMQLLIQVIRSVLKAQDMHAVLAQKDDTTIVIKSDKEVIKLLQNRINETIPFIYSGIDAQPLSITCHERH